MKIVKVQLSVFSGEKYRQVMMYDKDHSFVYQDNASQEIVDVMNDEFKKYFYYEIDENNQIVIREEAPWQDW